ncbi:MAG: DnaJ domain-containing protein, partial [Epsilonproteobacteria bacterium]|nr:DnaJ domain-containing protein [Campylobacterota bacterium]
DPISNRDEIRRRISILSRHLAYAITKLEDLKKRYRQLAKRYHPDRVNTKSPEIINKYTEKFKLLQEAYGALQAAG